MFTRVREAGLRSLFVLRRSPLIIFRRGQITIDGVGRLTDLNENQRFASNCNRIAVEDLARLS
ncbi:MAG: hypothetical protein M3R11_10390 [Acidobacteriota bacterium]|nr:hypothetical protein [Acidobacteriota bacterium]